MLLQINALRFILYLLGSLSMPVMAIVALDQEVIPEAQEDYNYQYESDIQVPVSVHESYSRRVFRLIESSDLQWIGRNISNPEFIVGPVLGGVCFFQYNSKNTKNCMLVVTYFTQFEILINSYESPHLNHLWNKAAYWIPALIAIKVDHPDFGFLTKILPYSSLTRLSSVFSRLIMFQAVEIGADMGADMGARLLGYYPRNVDESEYVFSNDLLHSLATGLFTYSLLLLNPDTTLSFKMVLPIMTSSLTMIVFTAIRRYESYSALVSGTTVIALTVPIVGAINIAATTDGKLTLVVASTVAASGILVTIRAGAGILVGAAVWVGVNNVAHVAGNTFYIMLPSQAAIHLVDSVATIGVFINTISGAGALAGAVDKGIGGIYVSSGAIVGAVIGANVAGLLLLAIEKVSLHDSVDIKEIFFSCLHLFVISESNLLIAQLASDYNSGMTLSASFARQVEKVGYELYENLGFYTCSWVGIWLAWQANVHLRSR